MSTIGSIDADKVDTTTTNIGLKYYKAGSSQWLEFLKFSLDTLDTTLAQFRTDGTLKDPVADSLTLGGVKRTTFPNPVDTGTATAGTSTTLTDSGGVWDTDIFTGGMLSITAGTGIGQAKDIASNTGTVITVSSSFTTTPDTTSVYAIHMDAGAGKFANGTAALPSMTFISDTNTGFYRIGTDILGVATAGTERMRVDASGFVGIGDTSPDRTLHVNSGADNANTIFESTDASVTVRFKDTTGEAELECRNDWRFSNNAGTNERLRIDSSGNVGIGTSSPTERLHVIGGNIKTDGGCLFNGDTAEANTLDDYEEGAWTPVLSDGTNNATMGTQVGRYTKIGNLVSFRCYVATTNLGSVSGGIRITGLPFTSSATTNSNSTVSSGYAGGLAITAGNNVGGFIYPNTTYIDIRNWDSTSGVTSMQESEWTADGDVMFTGHYEV
jgi:hypothetical protein